MHHIDADDLLYDDLYGFIGPDFCVCLFSWHRKVFDLVNGPGFQQWLHSGWLNMGCNHVKLGHMKAYVASFLFIVLTETYK